MLLGNNHDTGTRITGWNDSRRGLYRFLLGPRRQSYGLFKLWRKGNYEDVSTFHLNNLRISGSVSLTGETNRSLGRKYHYQKWGVELTRFRLSTFPSVGGFVSFSVSEIFMLIESCSKMNLRKGALHQKRWRASALELLIKWWIPSLWGWNWRQHILPHCGVLPNTMSTLHSP